MKFSKILSYIALIILIVGAGFLVKDMITQGPNVNTQQSFGKAILTIGFIVLLASRFISAISGRRRK